jgi:hypothetical protein
MGTFIGDIYCWFEGLFGSSMKDFLWGYDCGSQSFILTNRYEIFGLVAFISTLIIMLIYYYVISSPKSRWWNWLIVGLLVGLGNLLYAVFSCSSWLENGTIQECLLHDSNGNPLIFNADCWGVGITNGIIAFILFFIISMMGKWWSKGAKHVPFL